MATHLYYSYFLSYFLLGILLLPRPIESQGRWLRQGRVPFSPSEGHDKFQSFLQICQQFRSGDKSNPFPPPKNIFSKLPPEWLTSPNQTLADSAKKYEPTFQALSGNDVDAFYEELCPYPVKLRPDEQARQKGIKDACSTIKDALPTGTITGLPAPDSLWNPNSSIFSQIRNQRNNSSSITASITSSTSTPVAPATVTTIVTLSSSVLPTETTVFLVPTVTTAIVLDPVLGIPVTATPAAPTPIPVTGPVIISNLLENDDASSSQNNNTNGQGNNNGTSNGGTRGTTDAQRRAMNALFVGLANTTGLNFEDEMWNRVTRDSEQAFKITLLDRLGQSWNDDQKTQFWRSFCVANQPRRPNSGKGKKGKRGKGKRGGDDDEGAGTLASSSYRMSPDIIFTIIIALSSYHLM